MKLLRRPLTLTFTILMVLTSTECLRSYWILDEFRWSRPAGNRQITELHAACDGSWLFVGFGHINRTRSDTPGFHWSRESAESMNADSVDASMGSLPAQLRIPGIRVRWAHRLDASGRVIWTGLIVLSLWLPIILFASIVGYALWRSKRLPTPPAARHCPRCGYDLRTTPEKCPECGTIINHTGTAATYPNPAMSEIKEDPNPLPS